MSFISNIERDSQADTVQMILRSTMAPMSAFNSSAAGFRKRRCLPLPNMLVRLCTPKRKVAQSTDTQIGD